MEDTVLAPIRFDNGMISDARQVQHDEKKVVLHSSKIFHTIKVNTAECVHSRTFTRIQLVAEVVLMSDFELIEIVSFKVLS